MSKWRNFFVIITGFLGGCMMNTDYNPENFNPKKQSLVVLRSFYESENLQGNKGDITQLKTKWSSLSGDKKFIANRPPIWMAKEWGSGKGDYLLLAIDPGIYQLEELSLAKGQNPPYYRVSEGGATFEVKEGEVIYLGDLVLQDYFKGTFTVEDFFDEAKEFILHKHPQFAPKLVKNLVQVSKTINLFVPADLYYLGKAWDSAKSEERLKRIG